MKKILMAGLLAGSLGSAAAQSQVRGLVFEDTNGNGKKDKKEAGIPNVAVTNGRQVVLTDAKGAYTLPVGLDNIISVIKPSGYQIPVGPDNQPRFFRRHKPQGSPQTKFAGVAPTGVLPASVDFGLTKDEEPADFKVLVFGDPQAYTPQQLAFFDKGVVEETRNLTKDVRFGISLGDLVGDNPTLFQPYQQVIGKLGVPWFAVMGNHDMNYDAKADSLSDESFEAAFGPNTYAFSSGKVHFIVLDDILYPDPRDTKGYWGGLRPEQLEFVENDLKFVPKDYLVVLAYHIPMFDDVRPADRQRLFNALKDFPNTLALSAHTHYQRHAFFGKEEGFQREVPHHEYNVGTTSGDWYSGEPNDQGIPVSTMRDGTPKGYMFLTFNGNKYAFDYRVAGKPADYKIGIFAPRVMATNQTGKGEVYANFFQGTAKDELEYRIGNGEWKPMKRAEEPDPAMVETRFRWDRSTEELKGVRPSNPVVCDHLWKASLPNKLPVGDQTIEVRAKDVYGRTFTSTASIKVTAVPDSE
ncbi:MAG: calcineurin-like phosphoesterase family protein [Siphonobacter aquaeclarae]|nr:calcineurin-like phosphoesterase family protein [Siphonobacter aquaeclarae]